MDNPTREELRAIARTMKAIAEGQDLGTGDDRRDREIKSLALAVERLSAVVELLAVRVESLKSDTELE
jgi:hypothetical protein